MAIAEKAGVGKNGHVVKGSTLRRPKGGGAQSQRRGTDAILRKQLSATCGRGVKRFDLAHIVV